MRENGRDPYAAAAVRAAGSVEGVVPGEVMTDELRGRIEQAVNCCRSGEVLAGVDLSTSAMERAYIALLTDGLRYAQGGGVTTVRYSDLARSDIRLAKTGYGLRATVLVGDTALVSRGSAATNLLLEILYAVREELNWVRV
jgi:hypothetical protein